MARLSKKAQVDLGIMHADAEVDRTLQMHDFETGRNITYNGKDLLIRLYRPGETAPRGKQLTWGQRLDTRFEEGYRSDSLNVQVRCDEDWVLSEPDKALDRLHRYLNLVVVKNYLHPRHADHIFRTLGKEIQSMAISWNTTYSSNSTTLEYNPMYGSVTTNGSIGGYYPPPPPKPKTNVDWLREQVADMVGSGRQALNAA